MSSKAHPESEHSVALFRSTVMPGLVPGIPIHLARLCPENRDGRVKPGHDEL
jgi:hypothetical protein